MCKSLVVPVKLLISECKVVSTVDRGKICWAKYLLFKPLEGFCDASVLGLREQHMIHDGTDHTKGIRPSAGGVTSCAVGRVYYCYRCQSLLVIAGSTLGTVARTVEWFSAMVTMYNV